MGQSVNIDFGSKAGTPASSFGGVGRPGVWNAIDVPFDFPPPIIQDLPLVGLDGAPIAATFSAQDAAGTFVDIPVPHPEITGDLGAIFGDGLLGAYGPKFFVTATIRNLQPGAYRLITYAWYWPAEQFGVVVIAPGTTTTEFVYPTGGPWPGGLALGVNYMSNAFIVGSDGILNFYFSGAGLGAYFNGDSLLNALQLWKIEAPLSCPADLNHDSNVNGIDLAILLAQWGRCPTCLVDPCPCPADFDRSGVVNGIDLAMLLGRWGACPGPAAFSCGQKGAGDCYAAHGSSSCDESPCCQAVCARDPYCCTHEWDAICAGLANLTSACAQGTHPNCGNPKATPDCATASGIPGCSDLECCHIIQQMDPYCVAFAWDDLCAAQAALYCSKIPPACGHPATADCFDFIGGGSATPFCNDQACCEAVCAIDSFCCDVQWDIACVAQAHAQCKEGTCGRGAGDCFTAHPTHGCDDAECCALVCAVVPTCCGFDGDGGWGPFCVAWAEKLCAAFKRARGR